MTPNYSKRRIAIIDFFLLNNKMIGKVTGKLTGFLTEGEKKILLC